MPHLIHPEDHQHSVQINDMSFSGMDLTGNTHTGVCNVAFLDGHVGAVKAMMTRDEATWPDQETYIFRTNREGY